MDSLKKERRQRMSPVDAADKYGSRLYWKKEFQKMEKKMQFAVAEAEWIAEEKFNAVEELHTADFFYEKEYLMWYNKECELQKMIDDKESQILQMKEHEQNWKKAQEKERLRLMKEFKEKERMWSESDKEKDEVISELKECCKEKEEVISELKESDKEKDEVIVELKQKLNRGVGIVTVLGVGVGVGLMMAAGVFYLK